MPAAAPPRAGWRKDLSAVPTLAAVASLALLLAGAVLLNMNVRRLGEAGRLVGVTMSVLDAARAVSIDLVNAETGQRGYLLTGEERYLQPYEETVARFWADFSDLDRRVQVPEQQERLDRVRPLAEAKLAELAHTVELRRGSPNEALKVVRTDEGQRLMEAIRAELGAFEAVARRLLDERTRLQQENVRSTTYLAIGSGALALVAAALGAIGVVRRRDDRRLQEQNARLEREVQERTATLQETNAELEAFAATISHDLRAPVRAVGGFALALEEDVGDRLRPEERDYLGRIAGAAERMDGLIDDILGYSRLARQDLPLGRVGLEEVVDGVLDQLRDTARAVGAQLDVVRPLPTVRGHAGALSQAVTNLVSNALKFTAPEQAPEVRIRAEPREDGMVRLWVEDAGIGIPSGQQERIFRPFERLHGREAYPGSGVGLAIVRRTAERMGGRCGVTSAEEVGSRFWMDLPTWDGTR